MTKIFVIGDVLSFFIQGAGGGLMAGGDRLELGENIIIGALFLQIAVFGFFILATVIFHHRIRKQPTSQSYNPDLSWEKTIYVLYGISAIITIRNIFRVAEYIAGREGFLLRVEWPIYVFDAVFMAVTMATFYWWYPPVQQFRVVDSKISVETPPAQIAAESGGLKEERSSHPGHAR